METIKLQTHTGTDGVLRLEVPLGMPDASLEVLVVVSPLDKEPSAASPEELGWPPGFLEKTYGALAHDPIERPPQGEYEIRDKIE